MAGGTNFEGVDHAGLRVMVDSSDPGKVVSRGTQLKSAGDVLKDLSAALKSHVDQINWEGPAAEGFKAWAGNFHRTAALLGDYSGNVGKAINVAGDALSTAKAAMPQLPTTEIDKVQQHKDQKIPYIPADFETRYGVGATVDSVMKQANPSWVTAAEAQAAQKKVEQEHQEAVNQMVKLAQAYDAVTTTLNGLETPAELKPPGEGGGVGSSEEVGTGGGGGTGSGGAYHTPRTGGGGGGGSYSPPGGGGGGGSVTPRPPATVPNNPSDPGGVLPPSHGGQVPVPRDPGSPMPAPMPTYPGDRPGTDLNSLPPTPTLPNQTGPYTPGGGGQLPPTVPGGGQPGYPSGPNANSNFPGTGPFTPGGGGYVPSKSTTSNTFGGGKLPAKNTTQGIPGSGPVFGREAQAGRSGVGGSNSGMGGQAGGMHPGMGGHGGSGGSGGSARGRGLTSTGGGTVGGRKGPTTGGEFTPGGTGLRRAGAPGAEGGARSGQNGMMGGPMTGGGTGKSERERRNRADYLHEDEETWTSGTPQSNPNVIE